MLNKEINILLYWSFLGILPITIGILNSYYNFYTNMYLIYISVIINYMLFCLCPHLLIAITFLFFIIFMYMEKLLYQLISKL